MRLTSKAAALAATFLVASPVVVLAPRALAQAAAPAPSAEDARLTTFLDAEFSQEVASRPQLATRLGLKENEDKLDDNSEAAQLKRLEWRRGSVARMKAQFDRAKLSPTAQASYDIWALELARAETNYKYRRYQPPFYSFLYSVHTELPNFLINTHVVKDAGDMTAYSARLRAFPQALDVAIGQERESSAMGVRAPRFEVERVISGSKTLITGAPFDAGPDSPLWADAKAKVGRLQAAGSVTPQQAEQLLAEARTSMLGIKPAYERVIAWGQSELPTAPSGRTGAISLPGGAE